ncbi:MAG: acyltransferase family protein [Chthoniobacterales bacterium]
MSLKRLIELDSLRGIAAMSVVFFHTTSCFDGITIKYLIGPIFGSLPVVIFFVLSGFVLSNSLIRNNLSIKQITGFYIRRFFRIYPAVFFAIIVAAILAHYYIPVTDPSPGLGGLEFIIRKAKSVDSFSQYLEQFLLIHSYLNPPLWTIQAEFTCSLLLPWAILLATRFHVLEIPIGIISSFLIFKATGSPNWATSGFWFFSFFIGYLSFKYRHIFNDISSTYLLLILFLCIILTLFVTILKIQAKLILSLVGALLISIIITSKLSFLKKLLQQPILLHVGKVSFSLYLLHEPILLLGRSLFKIYIPGIFQFESQWIPLTFLFLFVLITSILTATIFEKCIETPFNRFGHAISNCLKKSYG